MGLNKTRTSADNEFIETSEREEATAPNGCRQECSKQCVARKFQSNALKAQTLEWLSQRTVCSIRKDRNRNQMKSKYARIQHEAGKLEKIRLYIYIKA